MTSSESEPRPTRRAAIHAAIRRCEEVALFFAFPLSTLLSPLREKSPLPPLHTIGYAPDSSLRLTNAHHPNDQGGSIHNLGVLHTKPFFRQHEDFFDQAITDCDALLLEGNPFINREYQRPSARAFFEQCIDAATAHQKTMYFIDEFRGPFIYYQGTFALPSTMLTALTMNLDTAIEEHRQYHRDLEQGTPSPLPLLSTRRNVLRALAGIGLGSEWILRTPNTDNPEEYDGYILRGRSAIMMRNTCTIAHAAPAAKLLTTTGNIHAELFEHYFRDPSLLKRDLRDYCIHDAVYSLPIQMMEPGDQVPKPL
ncbi:hypothetical protein HYZ98_01550 [Candidatus Peregrinibacteria bacterium]|nr:hypothetical protein [Candidatus Peregrinibacteria bacterium]